MLKDSRFDPRLNESWFTLLTRCSGWNNRSDVLVCTTSMTVGSKSTITQQLFFLKSKKKKTESTITQRCTCFPTPMRFDPRVNDVWSRRQWGLIYASTMCDPHVNESWSTRQWRLIHASMRFDPRVHNDTDFRWAGLIHASMRIGQRVNEVRSTRQWCLVHASMRFDPRVNEVWSTRRRGLIHASMRLIHAATFMFPFFFEKLFWSTR